MKMQAREKTAATENGYKFVNLSKRFVKKRFQGLLISGPDINKVP